MGASFFPENVMTANLASNWKILRFLGGYETSLPNETVASLSNCEDELHPGLDSVICQNRELHLCQLK